MDEKTNKPRTEWTNEQTPLSERTNEQATNHQDGDWMSKQTNKQTTKMATGWANKQTNKPPRWRLDEQTNKQTNHQDGDWMSKQTNKQTTKMATGWANKQTNKPPRWRLDEQTNKQTNHQDGDWMSKQTNHQVSKLMAIQINKQMHKQPINQRNNRASKPPSERTETNKKCYTELFSITIKISLDLNSPLGKTWTNNIRKWLNKCNTTWWLNIACFKAHVVLHRAWSQTNTWTIVPIWPVFSQDRAWGRG